MGHFRNWRLASEKWVENATEFCLLCLIFPPPVWMFLHLNLSIFLSLFEHSISLCVHMPFFFGIFAFCFQNFLCPHGSHWSGECRPVGWTCSSTTESEWTHCKPPVGRIHPGMTCISPLLIISFTAMTPPNWIHNEFRTEELLHRSRGVGFFISHKIFFHWISPPKGVCQGFWRIHTAGKYEIQKSENDQKPKLRGKSEEKSEPDFLEAKQIYFLFWETELNEGEKGTKLPDEITKCKCIIFLLNIFDLV